MSKPKPGKGGNLIKPELQSKRTALPVDKPKEKRIFRSIFAQGKDKDEVFIKVDNAEAFTALRESLGTENPYLWKLFPGHLEGCTDRSGAADNLNRLVPILHDIAPRDTLEAMLSVQMVGVHNVAMDCLRRAQFENRPLTGGRQTSIMPPGFYGTFTAQMEALQRYRGKSTQQKVTVEHVHVHQGGQAIVGAVNSPGQGGRGWG